MKINETARQAPLIVINSINSTWENNLTRCQEKVRPKKQQRRTKTMTKISPDNRSSIFLANVDTYLIERNNTNWWQLPERNAAEAITSSYISSWSVIACSRGSFFLSSFRWKISITAESFAVKWISPLPIEKKKKIRMNVTPIRSLTSERNQWYK